MIFFNFLIFFSFKYFLFPFFYDISPLFGIPPHFKEFIATPYAHFWGTKNEMVLDSLIQPTRIFSEDIRIQFWIDKCATFNKEQREKSEDRWYWDAWWEID